MDDSAATAVAADLLDPARAVAAAAGEDNGDRPLARILGQRAEKHVDRERETGPRVAIVQQQPPAPNNHFLHRWKEIDRVGFDHHLVLGLPDRHRRAARQQLVHETLEIRRQMLEDDERHAAVGGDVCKKTLQRLEPTG